MNKGYSFEQIRDYLISQGYNLEDINDSYGVVSSVQSKSQQNEDLRTSNNTENNNKKSKPLWFVIIFISSLLIIITSAYFLFNISYSDHNPSIGEKTQNSLSISQLSLSERIDQCNVKQGDQISLSDEYFNSLNSMRNCYTDLAVNLKNDSICDQLGNTDHRNSCHLDYAVSIENLDYCLNQSYADYCYKKFAIGLLDIEICKMIKSEFHISDCYESIAIKAKDPSLCAKTDDWAECEIKVHPDDLDISFCDKNKADYETENTAVIGQKDQCYVQLATAKKDPSICGKLNPHETSFIENCYSTIAKALKNSSICDGIYETAFCLECMEEEYISCKLNTLFTQDKIGLMIDTYVTQNNITYSKINEDELYEYYMEKIKERTDVIQPETIDYDLDVLRMERNADDENLIGFIIENKGDPISLSLEESVLKKYNGMINWEYIPDTYETIETNDIFVILTNNGVWPDAEKPAIILLDLDDRYDLSYICIINENNPLVC